MAASSVSFTFPEIKLDGFDLYLIGTAPLIVHAFPEKARKEMLDKQLKVAKGARQARDPYAEVEAARYRLPDGSDGFPSVAFKAAAVSACTQISDVSKVAARQAFRVAGEPMNSKGVIDGSFVRTALVRLHALPFQIREDVCRLSGVGRTPEMRYRPEFSVWGVILRIVFNPGVVSAGQIGSMFQAAGHGVGVGDYRPERDGDAGTFEVVSSAEFSSWEREHGIN